MFLQSSNSHAKTMQQHIFNLNSKLNRPTHAIIDNNDDLVIADTFNNRILVVDQVTGLTKLTIGDEYAGLKRPRHISVDQHGRYVVADQWNNRIHIIDPEGGIRSFGGLGNQAGQFNMPSGVTIQQNGNIVVSDTFNNRIQVFNPDGRYFESIGKKQLSCPYGITTNSLDEIIVSDRMNARVNVYDVDCGIRTEDDELECSEVIEFDKDDDLLRDLAVNVFGICTDAEDNIVVVNHKTGNIQWLNNSYPSIQIEGDVHPLGIHRCTDGSFLVCGNDSVIKISH